ncbi:hypothetical protein ZIOFF_032159 [Zingiber officinale]|uniref:Uncharacterized protein n=1 Tax=Zingiber officinale TaxID=94328 RepID=A0A8J5GV04_ZINOF|nr:hypothetical protein ZIOFF_032159 [Zingiber officinale]
MTSAVIKRHYEYGCLTGKEIRKKLTKQLRVIHVGSEWHQSRSLPTGKEIRKGLTKWLSVVHIGSKRHQSRSLPTRKEIRKGLTKRLSVANVEFEQHQSQSLSIEKEIIKELTKWLSVIHVGSDILLCKKRYAGNEYSVGYYVWASFWSKAVPYAGHTHAETGSILSLFGQDPEIAAEVGAYSQWMIPTLFAYGLIQCHNRFLQTQNIVFPMMLITSVTALLDLTFVDVSPEELFHNERSFMNEVSKASPMETQTAKEVNTNEWNCKTECKFFNRTTLLSPTVQSVQSSQRS